MKARDMIPLHAGSTVYVPKSDLIRIYTTNPSVYTGRLAELVFGRSTLVDAILNKSYTGCKNKAEYFNLDAIKLQSILGVYIKIIDNTWS